MSNRESELAERIAAKAKVEPSDVREVFNAHGVPLATPPARPRPLRVHKLRVAGVRTGTVAPGPFNSTMDFAAGLTALVAANFKGKTSVLGLITFCLRGTPDDLDGVQHWLHEIDVDATVAGQAMGFRLTLRESKIVEAVVLAAPNIDALRSTREPDPTHGITALLQAADSESYADQVTSLMMDWMDLQPLVSAHKEVSTQTHGWNAYFRALYLPTGRSKALIGDVLMAGLPGRLLQVFLDLPAVAVLAKLKTSEQLLTKGKNRQREANTAAQQTRIEERSELLKQLEQAQATLADLTAKSTEGEHSLTDSAAEAVRLAETVAGSQTAWNDSMQIYQRARAQRQRDAKLLNDVNESATARLLFHGLDPKACPRCDQDIADERRRNESASHTCAVCARPVEGDDDTPQAISEEAESRLSASKAAEEAAKAAFDEATALLAQRTHELEQAEATLRKADWAHHLPARTQARDGVMRLEGALSVLPELVSPPEDQAEQQTLKILRAAIKVLEEDHTTSFAKVSADINENITMLGRQFGVESLESVAINRAAQLEITRNGGAKTSFSGLDAGARVRMRVAVVVALMRIGFTHQISTHPGLLLIDSPKSEEVQDIDIRSLLNALKTHAHEHKLQVLITTADSELAHDVLPNENIIEATNGKPLW
ncbi:hypothetical protein [Rhodococcus sp. PvR099]|uniref:hypothetical protein n=1 Tax=Rhodococcus sp. PvR099 TaxID=2806602 RepID=UPI001AE71092|nr:hypothetical protein [Rhodococcus sp. PvR099]MBP1158618.1 hypothetical protein [Rhodococcus sp. PvR099]